MSIGAAIMDVLPRKGSGRNREGSIPAGRRGRIVGWIAIVVGVTMIATGLLLMLWGLTWQSTLETNDPEEDLSGTIGGPALLPVGVLVIAVGIIWILNAFRGFGRSREVTRSCPGCGRSVEVDLAFCYHCGAEIPEDPLPSHMAKGRQR